MSNTQTIQAFLVMSNFILFVHTLTNLSLSTLYHRKDRTLSLFFTACNNPQHIDVPSLNYSMFVTSICLYLFRRYVFPELVNNEMNCYQTVYYINYISVRQVKPFVFHLFCKGQGMLLFGF